MMPVSTLRILLGHLQSTDLVLSSGFFSKSRDGRNADRQVVSTNIENLGLFNKGPDLRLLKVLELVLVGGSQMGAHAAVVASDNHTTLAGRLNSIDTIFGVNTSVLTGLL